MPAARLATTADMTRAEEALVEAFRVLRSHAAALDEIRSPTITDRAAALRMHRAADFAHDAIDALSVGRGLISTPLV